MQKLIWQNADGEEINLTGGNYGITTWEGFSNTSLNIQSQQVPFQDGGVFLDALLEQRELSVTLAIYDGNNLETRYRLRRELIHILNPKLGEGYLIYTNDFTSKRIKCVPQIPLFETHNSNDSGTPKASLAWTACEPYWEDLEDTIMVLSKNEVKTIMNDGEVPTQVKIEFLTKNVVNPKIVNLRTNKSIKYNGTLDSIVVVDTNIGHKTVYSENLEIKTSRYNVPIVKFCYSSQLGLFVGVGRERIIVTSFNGIKLDIQNCGINTNFNDVIYVPEKDLFVTVSDESYILTSTDGVDWTIRKNGVADHKLKSIIYSSELNLFVAVGGYLENFTNYTYVLTSPDGINWTEIITENIGLLTDVVYSSELNLFVAVGGQNGLLTSPDGINWTSRNANYMRTIAYSSELNLFVAMSTNIYTSPDGINWTQQVSPISGQQMNDIIYINELNLFVAVGNGDRILTSPDGINWTTRIIEYTYEPPLAPEFFSVIYSPELKLLFGLGGDNSYLTSYDGINWICKTRGASVILEDVACSDELFIAVGGGDLGGVRFISSDGINWTEYDYPSFEGITYSSELNLFVAVKSNISTSSDGINWTERISTNPLKSVVYSSELNLFVAVGEDYRIYLSSDGINWTKEYVSVSWYCLYDVIYDNELNLFVTVGWYNRDEEHGGGFGGRIMTSPDGINWTVRDNEEYKPLNSVSYNPLLNLLVAVGNEGSILTSPDGINWTEQTNDISSNLNGIECSAELNTFVIVGDNGFILTSSDGINWIQQNSGISTNLNNVIYNSYLNRFVMVGDMSTILYTIFSEAENKINDISTDSDINLNIIVGENTFRVLSTLGNIICRILYRQKYLGV